MTDLQYVELNILKEFITVCEQLNLKYYLVCGSALGAAKYKGFIPWDDDVDVALPREDYNLFCERAQKLLPNHLFLQNNVTDPRFPLLFSKIRDSRTTYIEKSMSTLPINHGIYIDVFPIDGYPVSLKEQRGIEKEKKRYALSTLCCLNVGLSWKARFLVAFERLLGYDKQPSRYIKRINRFISAYSTEQSSVWCNHGNWQGVREYAPKEQYGNGIMMTFEGLNVRIPERFDEYLTQKYGDWRADLSEDKKVGHHFYTVCDIKHSYKQYFNH